MKYIKLNDEQAKMIEGKYSTGHILKTRPIVVKYNILPLDIMENKIFGIANRYIKKLLESGKAKIIDMADASDPDVIKLNTVFTETEEEEKVRVGTQITKLEYTKKEVKKEL